jgi:hypothetical protein
MAEIIPILQYFNDVIYDLRLKIQDGEGIHKSLIINL